MGGNYGVVYLLRGKSSKINAGMIANDKPNVPRYADLRHSFSCHMTGSPQLLQYGRASDDRDEWVSFPPNSSCLLVCSSVTLSTTTKTLKCVIYWTVTVGVIRIKCNSVYTSANCCEAEFRSSGKHRPTRQPEHTYNHTHRFSSVFRF